MSISALDQLLSQGIAEGIFPGAAYAVGNSRECILGFAGGHFYSSDSAPVDELTLWDLASLTKVVSTTTLAMMLYEQGALNLERPVAEDLPGFGLQGKGAISL